MASSETPINTYETASPETTSPPSSIVLVRLWNLPVDPTGDYDFFKCGLVFVLPCLSLRS